MTPHDPDSERCFLSCLFMQPEILKKISISKELFFVPANQILFECWKSIEERSYTHAGFHLLVSEIERRGMSEEIGGRQYCDEVWTSVDVSDLWERFYAILESLLQRRKVIAFCHNVIRLSSEHREASFDVRAVMDAITKEVGIPPRHPEFEPFEREYAQTLDWLETIHESYSKALQFGIPNLDQHLFISPGSQAVITAQTGGGKSSLAMQAAIINAEKGNHTAVFSLEVNKRRWITRLIANRCRVPVNNLFSQRCTERDLNRITPMTMDNAKLPIWIESRFCTDITSVINGIRSLHSQHGITMAIIDYLQILTPAPTKDRSREREIADMSRKLKLLAEELQIVTVLLSQLNDNGQVRESRAIEQDADLVLDIQRPEKEEGDDLELRDRNIVIKKQRDGVRGVAVPVTFIANQLRFEAGRQRKDVPRSQTADP